MDSPDQSTAFNAKAAETRQFELYSFYSDFGGTACSRLRIDAVQADGEKCIANEYLRGAFRQAGLAAQDMILNDAFMLKVDAFSDRSTALLSLCRETPALANPVFAMTRDSFEGSIGGGVSLTVPPAMMFYAVVRRADINTLLSKINALMQVEAPLLAAPTPGTQSRLEP